MNGVDERGEPLVGGHIAVDFCNTESWRLAAPERYVNRLTAPAVLADWAAAVGLLDAGARDAMQTGTEEAKAALREALRLRDVVVSLLDAAVDGDAPAPADLRVFRDLVLKARRRAQYAPAFPLTWHLPVWTLRDLTRSLALHAEDFLSGPELRGVRRCEGAGCGWFFVDRSRSHTRRWCSSADCGNRERVRRHYARTRKGGA